MARESPVLASPSFAMAPDITGVKLRHLYGLVALEHIELAQLLLFVLGHIIESIVILNYAGTNLEQRIFSQERIRDGFKDKGASCLLEIIVRVIHSSAALIQSGFFSL